MPSSRRTNKHLTNARAGKKDEFYTNIEDIEREVLAMVRHHPSAFQGKRVYCNCDDPFTGPFTAFFMGEFATLGLQSLTSTGYGDGYPVVQSRMEGGNVEFTRLEGDGDFRSGECIRILETSDVVVTNPPFSLFREFMGQLLYSGKKFLVLGNQAAITYRDTFRAIKDGQLWLGHTIHSGDRKFGVPSDYPLKAAKTEETADGKRYVYVTGVRWFTNMGTPWAGSLPLELNTRAHNRAADSSPNLYRIYDDVNAIEIPKTNLIPIDYDGPMGVPITYLDKHDPNRFRILAQANPRLDGKALFKRIIIEPV